MAEAIARLQAYRAHLIKAGKLLEARSVAHCISLVRKQQVSVVTKSGKPACSRA